MLLAVMNELVRIMFIKYNEREKKTFIQKILSLMAKLNCAKIQNLMYVYVKS